MYGKGFLGNLPENLQAGCVQSRQASFIQCFLKIISPVPAGANYYSGGIIMGSRYELNKNLAQMLKGGYHTLPPLLLQTPEKGGQGQWQITANITTSS